MRERAAVLINRMDPSRYIRFSNKHHDTKIAAILGISLGVTFFICFATGLVSHVMQHPPSWYTWPSRPAGFYRVNQGLHVAAGILAIPLLLAKLWVVLPKLIEWPPVVSVAHFLERASLFPLIAGGLFQLTTGVANINQWYFFPFFFPPTHYAVAWITIGALVIHIGAKATVVRQQLGKKEEPAEESGIDRRKFLAGVFGTGGLITLFSVGQAFSPLGSIAYLAPRKPGVGPQDLPVNKTASSAGVLVSARSDQYVLRVEGNVATPLQLTLEQLRALPQRSAELPISCVEGWSASARWKGVPVKDLLTMAGARNHGAVMVESLEAAGLYRSSMLNRHHATDPETLLALELNGEVLDIDHGYPCRLIGPNRPGVLQTKWVQRLVVS